MVKSEILHIRVQLHVLVKG